VDRGLVPPGAVGPGHRKDFYGTAQWRRYGGDLQGLLDRLDYLQGLGITALYLNPINDAPSLHKYDAAHYQHVDRNFGPDPRGDAARMAAEDFGDPASWGWTAADSLFLRLVAEVHRRGMRIILDYSWNHTGVNFPAWQDLVAKQRASRYADWYEVQQFDDPATPDSNEFRYRGWVGVPSLPEWKKVGRPEGRTHGAIEGNLVPEVRELVYAVSRRWLDPNGDGDPSDGIDGFRLDVAEMVPLGFWRDYRRFVRSINPEAYLVGEVWFEDWPRMYDPAPWLQGDVFDAVMHYRWFAPTRSFLAQAEPALTPSGYAHALDSIARGIPPAHYRTMMNLTASHDTPRFSTSLYNPGVFKFRVTPRDNPAYRLGRPDARTRQLQVQVLVQQFTWTGAPHIWNGDEVGMWGADDPDERKPMLWADLTYEDEAADPLGRARRRDPVAADTALLRTYRELIALRKAHLRLWVDGATRWLVTDDRRGVLAYGRTPGRRGGHRGVQCLGGGRGDRRAGRRGLPGDLPGGGQGRDGERFPAGGAAGPRGAGVAAGVGRSTEGSPRRRVAGIEPFVVPWRIRGRFSPRRHGGHGDGWVAPCSSCLRGAFVDGTHHGGAEDAEGGLRALRVSVVPLRTVLTTEARRTRRGGSVLLVSPWCIDGQYLPRRHGDDYRRTLRTPRTSCSTWKLTRSPADSPLSRR
jgi:cyclomaltodextrinase